VERIEAMAERLRLSTNERDMLVDYAASPAVSDELSDAQLDQLLYRHDNRGAIGRLKMALAREVAGAEDLSKIGRLSGLLERAVTWSRPAMPVKGADLLARGIPAGPEIGEKLAALEAAWLSSNFRLSKDELLAKLAH
jgi:poly(A) polymerase